MSPYDNPSPAFFGLAERLEPVSQGVGVDAVPLPLPPFLFDFNANSPTRQKEQALAWVAEAQQIIASQSERITYLETLTMTDELTGLLNRRGFFSHFRRELAHAQRVPAAGGVLMMIDLDGFKAINDSLGHDAGDAMLRRVSRLLVDQVRGQDVVARLGGDEFAVLLTSVAPTSGSERAAVVGGRINAETFSWHGRTLPITLSVGTCPFGAGDREEVVLRRADTAMYANKSERNPHRRSHR